MSTSDDDRRARPRRVLKQGDGLWVHTVCTRGDEMGPKCKFSYVSGAVCSAPLKKVADR